MSEEQWKKLERLRADLEVIERYFCDGCAKVVQEEIAEIEEAAADPWHHAKFHVENWRSSSSVVTQKIVAYVDHLAAENARLEKRVAELERASEIVRRLATYANELQLFVLVEDAEKLWDELKGAGDE